MKTRNMFYDGFPEFITDGAEFVGKDGIPKLLDVGNADMPQKLIPFNKAKRCSNKRGYVHFYIGDCFFKSIFLHPERYADMLAQFDGIITPDPTIVIGKSRCLHAVSTYANRAVGFYYQKQGIPVIPNIRWGDESTYEFAFLGVAKHSTVCISTVGAIRKDKSNADAMREYFKQGLKAMLSNLEPATVLVYGAMPNDIFGPYLNQVRFIRYPSEIEIAHQGGHNDGNQI